MWHKQGMNVIGLKKLGRGHSLNLASLLVFGLVSGSCFPLHFVLVSVMRRKTTPLYFTMATASLLESVHWRVKLLTPWNFCTVLHHLQWIHSPKIPKGGRGGPPCLCCVLVSIRVPVCLWYQCLVFFLWVYMYGCGIFLQHSILWYIFV